MISQTARRRLRVLAARGLRGGRTHSLSLVSAAVLLVLSYTALTSDAFQESSRALRDQDETRSAESISDGGLQYLQSVLWTPPSADLMLRSIVYYIIDSDAQRDAMRIALVSLTRGRLSAGQVGVEESIYFVRASNPEEEVAAERELARAAAEADILNYGFQVIDLRLQGKN